MFLKKFSFSVLIIFITFNSYAQTSFKKLNDQEQDFILEKTRAHSYQNLNYICHKLKEKNAEVVLSFTAPADNYFLSSNDHSNLLADEKDKKNVKTLKNGRLVGEYLVKSWLHPYGVEIYKKEKNGKLRRMQCKAFAFHKSDFKKYSELNKLNINDSSRNKKEKNRQKIFKNNAQGNNQNK